MGSRGAAGNTRKKDVLICELPLQRYRTNCHDREAGWDINCLASNSMIDLEIEFVEFNGLHSPDDVDPVTD
tara:strand:- start:539 stop:751 length:213 start_codon:yes stop_codon:yes gene_type:complete